MVNLANRSLQRISDKTGIHIILYRPSLTKKLPLQRFLYVTFHPVSPPSPPPKPKANTSSQISLKSHGISGRSPCHEANSLRSRGFIKINNKPSDQRRNGRCVEYARSHLHSRLLSIQSPKIRPRAHPSHGYYHSPHLSSVIDGGTAHSAPCLHPYRLSVAIG